MTLYSYKGSEPKSLPERLIIPKDETESGFKETRTSLHELSLEELNKLGFTGPYEYPSFDKGEFRCSWNGNEYVLIPLTDEEKNKFAEELNSYRKEEIDYFKFWNNLVKSSIYQKIRLEATKHLWANVLCLEIINFFNDVKIGKTNEEELQKCLNTVLVAFEFSEFDLEQFKFLLQSSNLDTVYKFPTEEYLKNHIYIPELNVIADGPKPFPSWSWSYEENNWIAPIPLVDPEPNANYAWNEETQEWFIKEYEDPDTGKLYDAETGEEIV